MKICHHGRMNKNSEEKEGKNAKRRFDQSCTVRVCGWQDLFQGEKMDCLLRMPAIIVVSLSGY